MRAGSELDGDSPDGTGFHVHALVRWDLRAIPAHARVARVRVALQILDWPGFLATYELRPLHRDWDETAATWQNATASQAWQVRAREMGARFLDPDVRDGIRLDVHAALRWAAG